MDRIIFSKAKSALEAKILCDMGVNIIGDFGSGTKNRYAIFHKDSNISDIIAFEGTKILTINDKCDIESYKTRLDSRLVRHIFLLDCEGMCEVAQKELCEESQENLYKNLHLLAKIAKDDKTLIKYPPKCLTPHIAYMAFSVGCVGILCDDICKNGGKFIHKINLAYKRAKSDRFYARFFGSKKPLATLKDASIDRILSGFSADCIALDLDNANFKTMLYLLKNSDVVKIGIVHNKKQFQIARNLQDNAILDVLELESSEGLEQANFAFYNRHNPHFDMQILD